MKNTSLHEVFSKYPFQVAKIAMEHGYSREWLKGLITGRMVLTPKKRQQHLRTLQNYFNKIGEELSQIKLTDE